VLCDLSLDDLEILCPLDLDESLAHDKLNAAELPPAPPPPLKEAARLAAEQFEKARYLFSIGMIADPQHGPLYHAYGNMELRHGNISGARDIFTHGISRNCSDVTSLFHAWGLLELKEGGADEAARIFRQGIELGLKGNREVENGVSFLLHSLGMLELIDK